MILRRGVLGANGLWWLDSALVPELPDFARAEPVYEGTYTRIWWHPDREALVSKLSWAKTAPRDNVRKYWACQAQREISANRIMQRLGLTTAELLGFGVSVAPWARLESILFMRQLPAHDTLRVVLRNTGDPALRAALLGQVATDLAAIYRNGYHHKDCHFENVLQARGRDETAVAKPGIRALIWIDNDLRYSVRPRLARRRLVSSLKQLRETSLDFVTITEWRAFAHVFAGQMRSTRLGDCLAATAVVDFCEWLDE